MYPYSNASSLATREVGGVTAATQLSNVACFYARFKARAGNTGKVYLGGAGVTKLDGTTDTTGGFELSAGEDTGWVPLRNLNQMYVICDNATDTVCAWVLSA